MNELPFSDVVSRLREALGVRLVAYIGSTKAGSDVTAWATGTAEPDEDVRERLLLALRIVQALREIDDDVTIGTWFKGMNPQLDDRAPAEVLREGRADEAMAAARGYMSY